MKTIVHSMMSRPNLVFSSKWSDSVMCAKFQTISMHYMATYQIAKDTTDEVSEGYIAEIYQSV